VRVVFFGTPEFAVPSLRALLGEGFDVAAVVTRPDKPRGRSRSRALPTPVKVAAQAEDVPVLQPVLPRDEEFVAALRALAPEIGVVVAYGHILPAEVLAIPRRGMVNVHASLLPELRGAAPIQWAIMRGLERTGVTIMQMDAGMDTGPVLWQLPTPLPADETAGELTQRLSELGALALIEALTLLEQDGIEPRPQDDARATHAPKITRSLARIRWTDQATVVARNIRALDPEPGAWTLLLEDEVKLFGATPIDRDGGAPGEILETDAHLIVGTASGAVDIEEVQQAGRRRMDAGDWTRGRKIGPGHRFA
jgi:methionyl-tRNA formyltransferase